MTNKLPNPLPWKVPKKFRVGCGDYLIILVLHGMSISTVCFFKIHGAVAKINWTLLKTKSKFRPKLRWYYIFYQNRLMSYMTLSEDLMSYSIGSWVRISMYLCWD